MIRIHRIPILLCFLVNIWIIFTMNMKVKVKVAQLCPSLWHPEDYTVLGILKARTLEWVAISFSSARKSKVKVKSLSRVQLLATPWTAAYQAPPSMGFSRQEYGSGVPLPSPTSFLICLCTCLFVSICYRFWSYTPSCGISSSWDMHVFKFSRNL